MLEKVGLTPGPSKPECCKKLADELKYTQTEQAKHCPGKNKDCPFTDDGEPIGVE